MKIYCESLVTMFNGGLGILPTSIVAKIDPHKPPLSLNLFYEQVKAIGCIDLIIIGPINEESKEGLSWLTPKLISEGYFISYFTDMAETLPDVIFTQYIFNAHYDALRRRKDLKGLGDKAIIILRDDSIDKLKASRYVLLQAGVRSKIMFDEKLISKEMLIMDGIYDLYPYVEI